jgi:DNA-binding transcriptional ArsR family regulator
MTNSSSTHPASEWEKDAQGLRTNPELALRLAAMAGHMRRDKIAARRAALIDLLADGRPHQREEIWETIATQLGEDCWGKLPQEALSRDLAVLRQGGIRIAYSRRPKAAGYYLQHPRLERPTIPLYEGINWELVEAISELSVREKNEHAFAAAEFALRQKTLILSEEHPEWSKAKSEKAARSIVYGTSLE